MFNVLLENILFKWRRGLSWKAQNVYLCSALRVFEQRGIFIVRYLQWHGASVFEVSSERPSQKSALYDKQGTQWWGPSLTRIPTGCFIMRTSNLRSWNWRPKKTMNNLWIFRPLFLQASSLLFILFSSP